MLWVLAATSAQAQTPAWQSLLIGTNGYGSVEAMTTDAAGNVYVAGYFNGRLTLGSTTLVGLGFGDAFVAKWNPNSNAFVWAKSAGGAYEESIAGIAVSGSNIYIVGFFSSVTATFGSTTLTNAQPASSSTRHDGFVAKLVDTGTDANFAWAQQVGGLGFDALNDIVANGTALYVAGRHGAPSATFGTITVTNPNGGPGSSNSFAAKFTDTGTGPSFQWVLPIRGDVNYAYSLALSGSSLYLSGSFGGSAAFGSTTLSSAGGETGYLVKVTDAGTSASFGWAISLGTGKALHVATDGASVYLAGQFYNSLNLGNTTLNSAGQEDVFIAKFTDLGNLAVADWANRGGGGGGEGASAIAVGADGVYVAGSFSSPTATFGSTTLTNIDPATTLLSAYPDLFLSKLTLAGNYLWTQHAGSTQTDRAAALALRGSALYVAGTLTTPATFGPFSTNHPSNYLLPFVASIGTGPLAVAGAWQLPAQALHPNPAHDAATVQLPAAAPGSTSATISLTDAVGRLVRRYSATLTSHPANYRLALHNLPAGLYSVRIQAGTMVTVEKLVVE